MPNMRQYDTVAEITQPGYVPTVSNVVYLTAGISLQLVIGVGALFAGLAYLGVLHVPVGGAFIAGAGLAILPSVVWRVVRVESGLTLKRVEKALHVDLDGNGQIGDEPIDTGHSMTVNAEQARADVRATVEQRKQITQVQQVLDFVDVCYRDGESESAHGVKPNDREAYKFCRDTLIRLELARWKNASNHNPGWVLRKDELTEAYIRDTVRKHLMAL